MGLIGIWERDVWCQEREIGSALIANLILISTGTALFQNDPNPFPSATYIPFQLAEDAYVTIRIYHKFTGQLIKTIDVGPRKAGLYTTQGKAIFWDGKDDYGKEVVASKYLYQLQANSWFSPMMTMIKASDSIPITESIVVYPNPFNANKGIGYVTFNGLTNIITTVRIYNLTGELIYETDEEVYNGKAFWGCKNNSGKDVASGIYIYLITNNQNQKATGKIGIVK